MKKNSSSALAAKIGMLTALAMILSFVETLIPISIGIPGVKLGLANLVTIVCFYTVGLSGAVIVTFVRIVLVGFTFGNMFAILYSFAGAAVSLLFMTAARKRDWFSSVGISILGGIGHNIGQICVAALVVQQAGVFYYLPVLLFAGTISGLVIGLTGGMVAERIKKSYQSF